MATKLTFSQAFSQPVIPISLLASTCTLLGFFFYMKSRFAKTEKQVSWILTLASSFVCTVVSIPYFVRFWLSGWDMASLQVESDYHSAVACFFISYLVLDLTLGSIYYVKQITILTGWIHHPLYIYILSWLIRCQSSSFFTTNCILELPTLVLALGSMQKRWRCDILFAVSFFVLRLVFHSYMIIALKQKHRLESLWVLAVVVFPLHIYWFYGIISSLMKKYPLTSFSLLSSSSKVNSTKIVHRRKPKNSFLERVYTI
ncbi:hypothetical protein A0J61_09080 [Choanephora cucurbitarum]|uniref:TLC domain-containing protein n=1 Tax=Choanephora cucurbitarum TaxID=101091 RepID=A0A1C7N199_9FUNG|nr:hypothetical protein A0J61_09080 [Choanephora cucurbitarum]